MSWLDANEVFLMEVVARDRVEDLRLAIALTKEPYEDPVAPSREPRHPRWYRRRVSAAA
jgi:hypothetical protein